MNYPYNYTCKLYSDPKKTLFSNFNTFFSVKIFIWSFIIL